MTFNEKSLKNKRKVLKFAQFFMCKNLGLWQLWLNLFSSELYRPKIARLALKIFVPHEALIATNSRLATTI